MDVQFRKHVFVHIKFEPRVFGSETKLRWLRDQSFTDQIVFDFLSQYANKEGKENSPILYIMLMSTNPTKPGTLRILHRTQTPLQNFCFAAKIQQSRGPKNNYNTEFKTKRMIFLQ